MWRASYNEDWERRKTYLLRSYFDDIPRLSTIEESSESSESASASLSQQIYTRSRPQSPLPDLIIEREKKVNLHDEPEEHYQKLEYKVKRYIKKLNESIFFPTNEYDTDLCSTVIIDHEIRSSLMESNCSNNQDGYDDIQQIDSDNVESKSCSEILQTKPKMDDTLSKYHSEHENSEEKSHSETVIGGVSPNGITATNDLVDENKSATFTEIMRLSLSSDSINQALTMQVNAEVHSVNEVESNIPRINDLMKSNENLVMEEKTVDEHLTYGETSRDSSSIENQFEVMRAHSSVPDSNGSLNKGNDNASEDSVGEDNVSFREHQRKRRTFSLPQNQEIDEELRAINNEDEFNEESNESIDEAILRCSTPFTDHNIPNNQGQDIAITQKNLKSCGPSSTKRKKTSENVCTQTSFASITVELPWNNIFVGTPKVFHLCKCKNHSCV